MNSIFLSIIIPCYNVEKYILNCLNSIYEQDFSNNNYEVICINDCSLDTTRNIILEYKNHTNTNLRLIDQTANGKQGAARNAGLKVARGEYIWFVDPDDFIEMGIFNILNFISKKFELEVLAFFWNNLKEDRIMLTECSDIFEFPIEGALVFSKTTIPKYTYYCWSWIVKKDFLIRNNIYFNEIFLNEDAIFGLRVFFNAKRFMRIPISGYNYRHNPASELNSSNTGLRIASAVKLSLSYYEIASSLKDNKLKKLCIDNGKYRLNSIVKPLLKLKRAEQKAYFLFLNKIDNKELLLNKTSYLQKMIIFYPISSQILLFLISPIYTYISSFKALFPSNIDEQF